MQYRGSIRDVGSMTDHVVLDQQLMRNVMNVTVTDGGKEWRIRSHLYYPQCRERKKKICKKTGGVKIYVANVEKLGRRNRKGMQETDNGEMRGKAGYGLNNGG